MLAHKLFGSGLNSLSTQAIGQDVASGLTATGSTRTDAYAMTCSSNAFTTVPAGTGAILYAGVPGDSQLVYNGGANTLKVYPPSGSSINALSANTPMSLSVNTACRFDCLTSTLWTGILSA